MGNNSDQVTKNKLQKKINIWLQANKLENKGNILKVNKGNIMKEINAGK